MKLISWHGNDAMYLDEINSGRFENIYYGQFGGATSNGAMHNEDGLIIIKPDETSQMIILMDAHTSNESIVFIDEIVRGEVDTLKKHCLKDMGEAVDSLNKWIYELFRRPSFLEKSLNVKGETAFLICFQKDDFLWWCSVGDNSLYVFHKEFNELGQYRINQRMFYQWIGHSSALHLKVPCYQSGTLQLREGINKIVLLTDGVLEYENSPYEHSKNLAKAFKGQIKNGIEKVLTDVETAKGRDSATMIGFETTCHHSPLRPSRR